MGEKSAKIYLSAPTPETLQPHCSHSMLPRWFTTAVKLSVFAFVKVTLSYVDAGQRCSAVALLLTKCLPAPLVKHVRVWFMVASCCSLPLVSVPFD